MIEQLSIYTDLEMSQFLLVAAAVFVAGLVRGFALSAILMASIVVILPPVELIPLCYILEGAASIAMFRGGVKQADMSVVWILAIGSAIGAPIGLLATVSISPELSKLIALVVVLSLTLAQLFKLAPRAIGSKTGLAFSGVSAGIVTGLASVGGLVVALYVLSSKLEAKTMRASLVMFLFIGMFTSLFYLLIYGLMDSRALARGLVFTPVVLSGVFIGTALFRPSFVIFYKQFCLSLLVMLSIVGLVRLL